MVFETVQTQGRSSFGSGRVSGLSGSLVSARVFTPHKHSGDARIKENSPGSLPSSRISLVCADRQYNSHRLHKQGGGIRSWLLMKVTILLFQLLISREWFLKTHYIPGKLNVIADQLSRQGQVLPTEWSLCPQVVKDLFQLWAHSQIDLFATRCNHKCPLFVSPVPDPLAWEIDTLFLDLEGLDGYAYPLHQLLTSFLQRYQVPYRCKIILIAPYWPNQPWFPRLSQLAVRERIQLPHRPSLIR